MDIGQNAPWIHTRRSVALSAHRQRSLAARDLPCEMVTVAVYRHKRPSAPLLAGGVEASQLTRGKEPVELLVVADRELQVTRTDAGLLVVARGVTSELENLGGEVLEDGSEVD